MISEKDTNAITHKIPAIMPGPASVVSSEMVRAQLNRVLAHPLFLHSKRSSGLLKFLVTHSLTSSHLALNERGIGIEVFGRSAEYDTTLDSTVRVAATEVRRRLTLYYSEPEHDHELRIELPTRSYVTEFSFAKSAQNQIDSPKPAQAKLEPAKRLLIAASLMILILAVYGGYLWISAPTAIERFWSPLFSYSGAIPISISSLNGQPVDQNSKTTYSELLLRQHPQSESLPQKLLITTNRDVASAVAIASYLGHHGQASRLQIAQNTTMEEMKRQPAFIIGGFGNEWAIRLGGALRFTFQNISSTNAIWIQDSTHPDSRKWTIDPTISYSKDRKEYALITRALDHSTGQWWIGVAGLTGLGTVVAQQMIIDPQLMSALGKQLPKDWEKKNLQVVLEINIVKESPGTPQVEAIYSW